MTSLDSHDDDVTASQHHWRQRRRYLNENRHRLSRLAEQLYDDLPRVRGLITTDTWIPTTPVPLEDVTLSWSPPPGSPPVQGTEPDSIATRPLTASGTPYPSYAAAVGQLAPPSLFEDRPCYRLTEIDTTDDKPRLGFGPATFFDIVNVCEATAHELAQAADQSPSAPPPPDALPLRRLVGDPRDLTRRPVIPAISVLTIRRSRTHQPTVVLHRRDATKVAHAGGMYQVMPVGIFQPSSPALWNHPNDFDLWRSITREYSEELLGTPEITGHDGPIDYDAWPFFQAMQHARDDDRLDVFWLGLGMDPLSLATDLLVTAVFDDDLFDELFHGLVTHNTEGELIGNGPGPTAGIPLTRATVEHYTAVQPMQAAGAALLHLAWHHRHHLLDHPASTTG